VLLHNANRNVAQVAQPVAMRRDASARGRYGREVQERSGLHGKISSKCLMKHAACAASEARQER